MFWSQLLKTSSDSRRVEVDSHLRKKGCRVLPTKMGVASSAAEMPTPKKAGLQTHLSQFGAGALAGLVNTLILSPLDVVKTRLQVQGSSSFATRRYRGLFHALRSMAREEGIQSYYRGLSASLWAFVPNWAIYWYTYETFKRAYTPRGERPSHLVHVLSAVSAGGVTAVMTAPFWTLKARLQIDMSVAPAQRRYHSVPHGFRRIVREEGLSGLYKGLIPTLLGLGHVAIQFPLYEHLKSSLSRRSRSHSEDHPTRAGHVLVASSLSKIVASAIFYPHEVVRTRIQVDTSTVRKPFEVARVGTIVRDILQKDGAKGLYRGFFANLARTVPACMLTFTSYELAKRFAETRFFKVPPATLVFDDLKEDSNRKPQ